jgi:hypothetical protein
VTSIQDWHGNTETVALHITTQEWMEQSDITLTPMRFL